MLIGITGPQGSGKSIVSDYIGEYLGCNVIHVDELAHEVLDINLYNEVLGWFNLPAEKVVDRKKLGSLLFASEDLMKKYNERIYELIIKRLNEIINSESIQIIDWNFLPISSIYDVCDLKVLVTAPLEERIKRVVQRDSISESYAYEREHSGISYEPSMYDLVLNNYNVELEYLAKEVKSLLCK